MQRNDVYDPYAFSGSELDIHYELFVDLLEGCQNVIDLACGPGRLLQQLEARGIWAIGVDRDAEAITVCREAGLQVKQADVFEYCRQHSDPTMDGVAMLHLVEHFPAEQGLELLRLAWDMLEPGGRLLVVTPNFDNPRVARETFWLDADHVRPYPRLLLAETLKLLGASIVISGDNPGPRRDFYARVRRGQIRTAASGAKQFVQNGFSLKFLAGDTYALAIKPKPIEP